MKGMDKVKLYKSAKESEIYHYFNANKEKLWMFRHKYYDVTGKRKEKKKSGFKTEKAALKALLEVKAATLRGETKHIENDNLTVGQWLDIWYDSNQKKWKETTRIQREYIIRLHLKPYLGSYRLQKLDRYVYQREFLNRVEGKFKPNTIQTWHNLFKIAINGAVEEEILTRNRFTKISICSNEDIEEKIKENFLTPAELVTFINDAKKHENITIYTILLTIAYTGIRRGESLGLQWKNIDFDNKTITIERTRDEKGIRSPKTKNSYRTILVDELVMNQLKTYKKWCKQILFKNSHKLTNETYVFINEYTGDSISNSNVLYHFNKLKTRTGFNNLTIHGLRHTHATILLNEGQNVKEIAKRLGNTVDMIYKIYGHVLKELEEQSVTLFSQSLQASGANFGASN